MSKRHGVGPRSGRLAIAFILAVTAFTAATAKDNPLSDTGYQAVEDTSCFPCHVTWSPPLKDFVVLVPDAAASGEVGGDLEYTLRIDNTWITDLLRFEPAMDIGNAPSLGFVTDQAPDLGRIIQGVIDASGNDLPISSRATSVPIVVEAGVTDLRITLEPDNQNPTTGPDLILNLYPGQTDTSGTPTATQDATGGGGVEVFHVSGAAEISALAFGDWTLEIVSKPLTQNPGAGGLADVPFSITVDKYYNASAETVKFLQRETTVTTGGSTAFTWTLAVLDTPAAGESVRLTANVTGYYEHDDSSTEDWSYTHHSIEVPLVACPEGGACFGATDTIVVTSPDVGVSMSRISEIVGYVSAFLVLASIYTGGMFGKASRRQLNGVFQSAKRRVAFHNFLSYGIILAAVVHTVIFLWPGLEGNYHWTQGLIWGTLSILAMFGLGITGALQVPMIRRWNYAIWRWSHLGLSFAVIAFTVVHVLLDGGNFGEVQEAVGWTNPLDPRDV